ncbi:SPW repeat domain-containing protein [Streptomyces candidus]|uniref:Peptidoglycan/LPS O-acetylase OafA/YrhL n=1 Tax=Streptomyces candidus TaxID=67283 RepID=A0A7X0LQ55_9ACTN|nr:SPW repeat protein [Streptomyces candidus]MBB6436139.1 peptidoglycan/LPS O-acetylase OafA/YrhL [Streptomyces candidus]GHH43778.1 hypothetical protein GCM10018773_30460 [Streptomyces candidus]
MTAAKEPRTTRNGPDALRAEPRANQSEQDTGRSDPNADLPEPGTSRQPLLEAQRQQIIGLLMAVSAVVLFVAPWIAGFPDTAKDAHRNELGVGLVVLLTAIYRFTRRPGKWPDVVVLVAGGWMIAAPWVLSGQNTEVFDGAQVIDVAVGVVLVVLAGVSLLMRQVSLERGRRGAARRPGGIPPHS